MAAEWIMAVTYVLLLAGIGMIVSWEYGRMRRKRNRDDEL